MNEKRILTLASGRGSNFQAVIRAVQSGKITGGIPVGLVIDRPNTGAESFARENDIPAHVVEYASFPARRDFDIALLDAVDEFAPDLVLTLGFMRILNDALVEKYAHRMINIHPSLLPAFPGIRSQRQALEYGVRVAGATAHFVDKGVDTGPIILQATVPVRGDHTLEELEADILGREHEIIVDAVRLFCADALQVEGRKILIRETTEGL